MPKFGIRDNVEKIDIPRGYYLDQPEGVRILVRVYRHLMENARKFGEEVALSVNATFNEVHSRPFLVKAQDYEGYNLNTQSMIDVIDHVDENFGLSQVNFLAKVNSERGYSLWAV
jgi:hypothetical protein